MSVGCTWAPSAHLPLAPIAAVPSMFGVVIETTGTALVSAYGDNVVAQSEIWVCVIEIVDWYGSVVVAETTPAAADSKPVKPVGSVTVPVKVGDAAVANVDCAIVAPLPSTRFVPDNAETTPVVLISVPVVNPERVRAGVVTVPVNVGLAISAYVDVATREPLPMTKKLAVDAVEETTPAAEFSSTPAVVSELNVGALENVCTPVKVCAASVLASVADVVGNVIVVPSVPVTLMLLLIVSFLPEATESAM